MTALILASFRSFAFFRNAVLKLVNHAQHLGRSEKVLGKNMGMRIPIRSQQLISLETLRPDFMLSKSH